MTIDERIGFVTLATTDSYAAGALVLARSLRQANTVAELVCLVSNSISEGTRMRLESEFDEVVVVDVLNSNNDAMLTLLKRPELGVTLTKLHCWKLTQYQKMVFLDADTLVIQNVDDLFQRDEISAVADCGWPSCFNSGVFVFKPSIDTFNDLIEFAKNEGSFDGGDQGLLNDFFSDWSTKSIDRILPFGYNVHAAATYAYVPAFRRFKDQVKVVHFLGSTKPWSSKNPPAGEFSQFWQLWWSLYESKSSSNANSNNIAEKNSSTNSYDTPIMTPSGFTAVGHSHVFQPTSPVKAGFDIIQDHLNAQLSSADSEPAPKFDIKPTNLARPILFRKNSQSRKSSEPDSGHGSEIEEKTSPVGNQSILERATPKYVKASPEIITASKKKAFLTSAVPHPVLSVAQPAVEPVQQPVVCPRTPEKKRDEEINTETMIETRQEIQAQDPETELDEKSSKSEENTSSSIHPNTSDYIEEAKKICAGVFNNITERFSGEKSSNEEIENEDSETRDRARSYAIVEDRDIMASEREAAPIRKSRSMTDLLLSSNGVLIIGILGALVSAGYMFFRHQYS